MFVLKKTFNIGYSELNFTDQEWLDGFLYFLCGHWFRKIMTGEKDEG